MSDEPNLFGVKSKAKRKASPPIPGGAVQRLIGTYRSLFEAKFHETPTITAADGAALKRLVAQSGADVVERRLRLFLEIDDPYTSGEGYPLRLMPRAWNKLIVQDAQAKTSRTPDAERTDEYLRSLKRAK